MLNSLAQQQGRKKFEINVVVSSLIENSILLNELCFHFNENHFNVKLNLYHKDIFAFRGLTRNVDFKLADHDSWILFADCDHIYRKDFLHNLFNAIENKHYKNSDVMYTTHRFSMAEGYGNKLVDGNWSLRSPRYTIPCVDMLIDESNLRKTSNVGAGNTQLIEVKQFPDRVYVNPSTCKDKNLFDKGCHPKSDIQFRRSCSKVIKINDPNIVQYHLNHSRHDSDNKEAINEQR